MSTLSPEIENLNVLEFDLPGDVDTIPPPPNDYFSEFQEIEFNIKGKDYVVMELDFQRDNITRTIGNTLDFVNERILKNFRQFMTIENAQNFASSIKLSADQMVNVTRILEFFSRRAQLDPSMETVDSHAPLVIGGSTTSLETTVGLHARLVIGLCEILVKVDSDLKKAIEQKNHLIAVVRAQEIPIRAALTDRINGYRTRHDELVGKREIAPIYDLRIIELETIVDRKIHELGPRLPMGPLFEDEVEFFKLQYRLANWEFLNSLRDSIRTHANSWRTQRETQSVKIDEELGYLDHMIAFDTHLLSRLDFYKSSA